MTGQETNTRAPAIQPGPRPWEDRAWVRGLSLLLRLGLAAVWLVAGALKVTDPDGMERSVRAFRILPEVFVEPVSYALPFVELALGALLLVGLAVRAGAAVSALLFAVYVAAIASAAARGLRIDCGCFSSGGDLAADEPTRYAQELTRDSLLLVASLLLARFPRGYLAVDQLLFGPSPAAPTPADWDDDGDDDP
ncbi:MAG: DoxX family membrane protein, partial [Frankia sp.]|nr:DoxX family membrane protein [Frankia sp.]